jgi:membrane protein
VGAVIVLAVGFAAAIQLPGFVPAGAESQLPSWLAWTSMLVLTVIAHALLFRFGPSRATTRWQPILTGSVAAAMLWLAVSGLFSFYVNHFSSLTALYGPLGSVVAFMTWLWLSALATLVGAEIDAVLSVADQPGRR